jgi:hypothetical protein
VPSSIVALNQSQRGKILAAVIAVLVIGFTAETTIANRGADSRGKDLQSDLIDAYHLTTSKDLPGLGVDSDAFLARSGHEPDATGQVPDGIRSRYRVGMWGKYRCVVVHWIADGVDISKAKSCSP